MKGTKKILLSVMALVVTLAMAVTSTYAWFTTNTYATLEGFNVEVKTEEDEGLFVRLAEIEEIEGMSYGKSLTTAQIEQAIKTNYVGSELPKLEPLTTLDGHEFYQLGGDGVIAGDAALEASTTKEVITGGRYVKFTLEFQSTYAGNIVLTSKNDNTNISSQGTKGGTITAWEGFPGYNAGDSVSLRAANAARVTFKSVPKAGDGSINVWAPNAMIDSIQEGYYDNVYGWAVTLPKDYKYDNDTRGAANQVTIYNEAGDETNNADESTIICQMYKLNESDSTWYGKVEVYIWLDGNDGSAINQISGDFFNVKLEFRRIDEPTNP